MCCHQSRNLATFGFAQRLCKKPSACLGSFGFSLQNNSIGIVGLSGYKVLYTGVQRIVESEPFDTLAIMNYEYQEARKASRPRVFGRLGVSKMAQQDDALLRGSFSGALE